MTQFHFFVLNLPFKNLNLLPTSKFCTTPEQFKAYSQNLGHENVLTTFTSYGCVDQFRQGEIVREFGIKKNEGGESETSLMLKEMMRKIENLSNK